MWEVQEQGKVKRYSDRMVRTLLARGQLSGAELVREGDGPWVALHETALFAEEVPHTGNPRNVVIWRAVKPWLVHAGFFVAVVGAMGFPDWWVWWALGVAAHGLRQAPVVWAAWSMGRGDSPPRREAVPDSPLDASSRSLLDDLGETDPALSEEVGKLDALGRELARRIAGLNKLVDPAALAGLQDEAGRLRAEIEVEQSARGKDVRGRELASLEERIAVMEEAAQALGHLQAEERALVHQVEGLRVALARASVGSEEGPDLLERVRTLREKTEAQSEVDDALARARAAQGNRVN